MVVLQSVVGIGPTKGDFASSGQERETQSTGGGGETASAELEDYIHHLGLDNGMHNASM